MTETKKTCKATVSIAIPEAIPEIGLEAGTSSLVDFVWADGTMLHVDCSSPQPASQQPHHFTATTVRVGKVVAGVLDALPFLKD